MQSVTPPPSPEGDLRRQAGSPPQTGTFRARWPWWSIGSLVVLVMAIAICAAVAIAYNMRPAPSAAWPTVVLLTVPAQPSPLSTAGAPPTSAPWPSPTRYARVSGTQGLALRIRTSPSIQAETVKLVPDGTRLVVTGEARQADGYLWWPVRDPSDNKEGWAVGTYLVPVAGP